MNRFACLVALLISAGDASWAQQAPVFEVRANGAEESVGVLERLDEQGIGLLDSNQKTVSIKTDDLVSLTQVRPLDRTAPAIRVQLRSGTELSAQSVSMSSDNLSIEIRRQNDLSIPLKMVRSIRFRRASPNTDPKWLGLFEAEGRGDLLAARREGDNIDSIRGVVLSIASETVQVDLDGTTIPAPIEKLEGIIFGGSDRAPSANSAAVIVEDAYDSRWICRSTKLVSSAPTVATPSMLEMNLVSGLRHVIPLEQVLRIKWAGSLVMLANLTAAESTQWTASDGISEPADIAPDHQKLMKTWLGPQATNDFNILMGSGSSLTYRRPESSNRLVGSVRRESAVLLGGRVTARVLVDGKVAWEQELKDVSPLGFDLPLGGNASRIRLDVDASGDGVAGDLLRWTQPRFLK
ncbi:MAG: NPCBM/NEW2 domain-containing protein [Planctomycetota bacterium]